MNALLLLGWTW